MSTIRAYLDNASTTRPDPRVLDVMARTLRETSGNPSSIHAAGRVARKHVEDGRSLIADLLSVDPKCLVFTSGATEADNLAVLGIARALRPRGNHLIVSCIEHPAVLEAARQLEKEGFHVSRIPVDSYGRMDPAEVERALTPQTVLISIMLANNEVGTVQPIPAIGEIARSRRIFFHTDAAQACGKLLLRVPELAVDAMTLSAHKMHGPKGTGLLYLRKGTPLLPLLWGGGQEFEQRAGTENVAGVAGFAEAFRITHEEMRHNTAHIERQRERLRSAIERIPSVGFNGHPTDRLPSILNVSFEGIDGEAIIIALDQEGICVSSGSACASQSLEPSHVLVAMGLPPHRARASVRFSIAMDTSDDEIDFALDHLPRVVGRLRSFSPVYRGPL